MLDIGSIAVPFAYSFEKRMAFYKNFKPLFTSLTIVAAVFLAWDALFTQMGIWGFNPTYLQGIELINLPVEEWLFFWCIPFSCVFIYASMNYFIKKDILKNFANPFSLILAVALLIMGCMNIDRWYTSVTFISTGIFLLMHVFWLKKSWLGRFYVGYFVSLIPFFIINGLLTGSMIKDQVVWYNNAENLSIRMGTIPVEDSMYMLLLLLLNVTLYEYFKKKWAN